MSQLVVREVLECCNFIDALLQTRDQILTTQNRDFLRGWVSRIRHALPGSFESKEEIEKRIGIALNGMPDAKPCHSIIGHAKTTQSAILVVEYLRARKADPHSDIPKDAISYRECRNLVGEQAGFDIIVRGDLDRASRKQAIDLDFANDWVEICRAFLCGCGEYWA